MKKNKIITILFVILIVLSVLNIYLIISQIENKNQISLLKNEISDFKNKLAVLEEKNIDYDSNFDKAKNQDEDVSREQCLCVDDISICKADIVRLENYIRRFNQYKCVIGHIKSYSEDGENLLIDFDDCEMIDINDLKRIKELGLNPDKDFPSGYYIYDEDSTTFTYKTNNDLKFYLSDSSGMRLVSKEKFFDSAIKYSNLVRIVFINDKIVELSQIYRP